ncbi:MAG: type II toxin-antitoxin system VapC family toxin [Thermoleophilia bacterium]|nr:type II toxin-antitoxin system VapC family toxin [Thermoleophilia bacterium]
MESLPPAVYCDTSALAKLVFDERESGEFAAFVDRSSGQLVSSQFGEIELMRAAGRIDSETVDSVLEILAQTILLPMTSSIQLRASYVRPPLLRSLDAIHLATAMEILVDLECLVTYDRRLAEAASEAGLKVVSPGAQPV